MLCSICQISNVNILMFWDSEAFISLAPNEIQYNLSLFNKENVFRVDCDVIWNLLDFFILHLSLVYTILVFLDRSCSKT